MKTLATLLTLLLIATFTVAQDDSSADSPSKANAKEAEAPQLQSKFKVGDPAPLFSAVDNAGNNLASKELLIDGPIVLVFYRGEWCGYCKKHLAELQKRFAELKAKGASIVVVTPETQQYANEMAEATGATYSIVSDTTYKIMRDYGVDFTINKTTVPRFYDYVVEHTAEHNGNDEGVLPIPATYIIGKGHKIQYVFFDPDYRNRPSVDELLENL